MVVAPVQGASVPGLDVTVKQSGKAVYQGKTDAQGGFTTGALQPGQYNIEFRAPKSLNLKGQELSLSVAAGKEAARESKASGAHLQSGVAMSFEVTRAAKLSGSVNSGSEAAASSQAVPAGMEKVKANVKVIKGQRYVWVPGPIGSNIDGKWVEEGTEGAALSTSNKKGGDNDVLRHVQDQSSNVGRR
ncbi:MAG: carboxypeptidase-like regulatory domain-containing protein [Chthoniobacterales bacterium]